MISVWKNKLVEVCSLELWTSEAVLPPCSVILWLMKALPVDTVWLPSRRVPIQAEYKMLFFACHCSGMGDNQCVLTVVFCEPFSLTSEKSWGLLRARRVVMWNLLASGVNACSGVLWWGTKRTCVTAETSQKIKIKWTCLGYPNPRHCPYLVQNRSLSCGLG